MVAAMDGKTWRAYTRSWWVSMARSPRDQRGVQRGVPLPGASEGCRDSKQLGEVSRVVARGRMW